MHEVSDYVPGSGDVITRLELIADKWDIGITLHVFDLIP